MGLGNYNVLYSDQEFDVEKYKRLSQDEALIRAEYRARAEADIALAVQVWSEFRLKEWQP